MRRRERVLGRRARGLLREVGREALVVELDRDVDDGAKRLDEALGLGRLLAARRRAASAAGRRRRARRPPRATSRASSARPARVAGPLDDAERPRQRAGRVGDGDAGARRAVVERHHLHAHLGATSSFAAASASAMPSGFLPPASASVGLPPPPPPMCLPQLAHDLHGVEPARDERLVEVDDEEDAPVVARGDDRAVGLLLLADPVGEVAQRPALEALDLDEQRRRPRVSWETISACVGLLPARFDSFRACSSSPRSASASRARSWSSANASPAVTASIRRAPAPTELSDEDRERPDLRGRADVRAAAELARPAVDVDDAHDVAVLLAEQHHRAEVPRLRRAASRRSAPAGSRRPAR